MHFVFLTTILLTITYCKPFEVSLTINKEASMSKNLKNHPAIYSEAKHSILGRIPEGEGLFRDPIEVLGHKFLSSAMMSLCEMKLWTFAETISNRKFTENGTRTCTNVCRQYRTVMLKDGPIDIKLTESYCGYSHSDASDENFPPSNPDLSTTCTCVYKIECNLRTTIVIYTFEVNCEGYMRVTTPEMSDTAFCVT